MYSTVFQGEKVRIKDDHLEQLLERFDYRKFSFNDSPFYPWGPKMQNNTPCILCKSFDPHHRGCSECPLAKFRNSQCPGCIVIIIALVSNSTPLHTFIGSIVYSVSDKARAVKDLKTITKFLKSFKKEKSNG